MRDRVTRGAVRRLLDWIFNRGNYDGKKQAEEISRLTEKLSAERLKVTRLQVERLERREVSPTGGGDRANEPDATAAGVGSHYSAEGWSAFAFRVEATGGGDRANEPDAAAAGERLTVVVTLPSLPPALSFTEKRLVRSLAPEMQWKAVDHYWRLERRGIRLQFNSGTRTPAEQAAIRARTESAAASGVIPAGLSGFAAKRSFHEVGLAYDGEPVPKNDSTWDAFGVEAEALGLEWGGRWTKTVAGVRTTDRPHVQMRVADGRRAALASAFLMAGMIVAGALGLREKTQ